MLRFRLTAWLPGLLAGAVATAMATDLSAGDAFPGDLTGWLPVSHSVQDTGAAYDPEAPVSSDAPIVEPTAVADLEARMQQLESELAQLRSRPQSDAYHSVEHRLQRQETGSGGLFGVIEVLHLRPHLSGASSAFGLGPFGGRLFDTNYETSLRYILGWKSDSGFGIRARYWDFDEDIGYVPPFSPLDLGLRLQVIDLETTLDQRLRHFDLSLSGGVRYTNLEYTNAVGTLLGIGQLTFEGVGPTVSMMARRQLGCTGLSVFGSARGSLLVGDIRNGAVLTFMPRTTVEDEVMLVPEFSLGSAWTKQLPGCKTLEIRTAWETQYWINHTLADDVYGIGSNLGFSGPMAAIELKY